MGPNPVDRGKPGSKRHLLVDGDGVPLAVWLPAANVHDSEVFEDVVGRNFRQPAEGLGFDCSPVAHMWRTMIWPNNFL